MTPLLAFSPGPNYQWKMAVGPVTLAWEQWTLILLACAGCFAVVSAFMARRYGRWWLTALLNLATGLIAVVYLHYGSGAPPHMDFQLSWYVFIACVPLMIVHAVVSFTMPRRRPSPAEPAGRYNSP